nr:DNA-directed DNA polymerase [Tanacetum cinerariifolium]
MNMNSRENASKTDDRINKLADQISTLVDIVSKKVVTPATVKVVEESCVTCGGNHAYYNCDATNRNQSSVCTATGTYNQVAPQNRASNYMAPPDFAPVQNNGQNRFNQTQRQGNNFNQGNNFHGTLPSNTIPNPKGKMKAITTRSGVAYKGPSIPTKPSPKKVVERGTKETMDKEQTNFQESTTHIQPLVVPIPKPNVPKTLPKPNIPYPSRLNDKKLSLPELTPTRITLELADRSITHPKGVAEDVFIKVGKFHFPTDFVVVDFEADPRVPLILGRSFLRTGPALIDVYGEEITLWVDEAITFNLNQTTRYSSTYDDMLVNQIDVIDVVRKDYAQEMLVKAKSSIEEPPELELKDLPSHLEYAYLEGVDKLPVINAKDLKVDKKEALLKVLKSHKRAIAWKITDIKGIDPRFCTHKILMEEDYKPAVQSQRRVNPKIHEVIKKEVIKLLDAGMIYPISDSSWVSPICCVPKKGGITVVENENNALIPTRFVTDQEKTTFTCPCGTFAYQRMPFSLCNAPRTFQRCMMAIFHDMIEKTMEVFMDDFLVFGDSFSSCLSHLDTMFQRFIQDFSKIARPMTHLLEKETSFLFSKDCIDAFKTLKKKLTEALILVIPDWNLPFELIKTMTEAQIHYTATEKEMLAVVYAFEKFRPHLVLSKSIVYTDHSALDYLLSKQDAKPRLLRWVLLLQEFDIIICDKKGMENLTADHLSRLENPYKNVSENKDINKKFPLETLGKISSGSTPWFADFANFHAGNFIIKGMSSQQKKKFFKNVKHYFWDDPYFFGFVRIKSFDDVCMAKKLMIFSKLVMKDPPGAIMVPISPLRKYLMSVSFGQPFIEMLTT